MRRGKRLMASSASERRKSDTAKGSIFRYRAIKPPKDAIQPHNDKTIVPHPPPKCKSL